MKTLTLGDVRIQRVVEMEGPFAALDFLLPDADPEVVAANAGWLKPDFVDPATGQAIMSFHSFVVRTERHTILVDACIGNDKHRPLRPPWHMKRSPFLEDLAAAGVRPEQVDFVLCTHLHADHVGWNTRLVDGRWTPTFPNAQYIFARREYDFWRAANESHTGSEPLNHGSYFDSVLPVVEAGRAVIVEDDHQIEDGVWLEPAPGHTPGNVVVNLASNGRRAVLTGDVLHHPVQLAAPDWSSTFCSDPDLSRVTRRALIETHADTDAVILTAHFPTPTAGRIVSAGDAFRFQM